MYVSKVFPSILFTSHKLVEIFRFTLQGTELVVLDKRKISVSESNCVTRVRERERERERGGERKNESER